MGEKQLSHRAPVLAGLVPVLAVPQLTKQPGLITKLITEQWQQFGRRTGEHRLMLAGVEFLYTNLAWDSAFFSRTMARLQIVLFGPGHSAKDLTQALREFNSALVEAGINHCYCEVAAADILLLYALGSAGWGLTETRLQYYHDELTTVVEPRRSVRAAQPDEAELIASISATNRNSNDRFHADPAFGPELADAFLAEYARATVRGFCDVVLVPEQPEVLDSFLAVSFMQTEAQLVGANLGRVVLTAVGPRNRGWHRALVAEALYRVRERGGQMVFMTTQAANAAVVRNAQQLGFKLGGVTQLFSIQPSH